MDGNEPEATPGRQDDGRRTRRDFFCSLIDQCAVSGGNFLTIALGAAFLPIDEQGRLVYVYTAYIALVLFNTSAYFSVANIVRHEVASPHGYRQALLAAQMAGALPVALALLLGFLAFQGFLKWQIGLSEALLLLAFLIVQQIADFYRRSGYVFDRIGNSALQSLWVYGARLAALLALRPETVSGFLLAMLLPGMPLAMAGLAETVRRRRARAASAENRDLLRSHLRLGRWNIAGAPLRWGGLHLPIMLAGALHSIEAAAVLGTLRAITTFVNVLLELLETFIPAWLAARGRRGEGALISGSRLLFLAGAAIWLAGAAALFLLGETAILHLLGADYAGYAPMLHIIWAGNGMYFAGRVVGLHYRMQKNTRLEATGLAVGIVALLASLPLISAYGAWGAAWCLFIVQVATLAALLVYRLFPGR